MPRKNLKKEKISVKDMVRSAKGLAKFDAKNETHGRASLLDIFLQLFVDDHGHPTKRGFFFSVFGIIAIVYVILSIACIVDFRIDLGGYILSANITFGVAYHVKGRKKEEIPTGCPPTM